MSPSVQYTSVTQSCLTLCDPMDCSTSGFPVLYHLPDFTQTHVGDAIQPSHLLSSLLLLPSIFPSIRVFSNEPALCIRWPNWFPLGWTGWISLQSKWLLRVFSNTNSSKLQQFKASILQRSAFFIVQLSHPYTTTGKAIALIRQTFVGKVMSLLFNMLSTLVITFLPRSKRLFISWLQSPSAVILEPKK